MKIFSSLMTLFLGSNQTSTNTNKVRTVKKTRRSHSAVNPLLEEKNREYFARVDALELSRRKRLDKNKSKLSSFNEIKSIGGYVL